jgi:hypothetical protein
MPTQLVTGGSNGPLAAETVGDTMNGPLTLSNQSVAPSAASGAAVLSALGGMAAYVNSQGLLQSIVGSQGGLTAAGAAITGATTEAVLQSMSLPANDAVAGSIYAMVGFGVFSSTASPGSTVFTSRLGGVSGTSLVATANITLGTSLTNAQFEYVAYLNFLSATTANCVVKLAVNSAAAGAASLYVAGSTAAVTVSLSTAKTWVLDITPGASGNSIQLLGGTPLRIA